MHIPISFLKCTIIPVNNYSALQLARNHAPRFITKIDFFVEKAANARLRAKLDLAMKLLRKEKTSRLDSAIFC